MAIEAYLGALEVLMFSGSLMVVQGPEGGAYNTSCIMAEPRSFGLFGGGRGGHGCV